MIEQKTAKARYEALMRHRELYLHRAIRNAELTIPSLLSRVVGNTAGWMHEPYQSVGAEGVVHLSARLLMVLLPPGRSFFKLDLPEEVLSEAATDEGMRSDIVDWKKSLAHWEASAQQVVNTSNWRTMTDAALQQLVVAGNVLEEILPTHDIKLYSLPKFVVRRSHSDELVEIITLEKLATELLPDDIKSLVKATSSSNYLETNHTDLYTWHRFDGKVWHTHQEVEEKVVPETKHERDPIDFPFKHHRWAIVPGETYGRSKIEEHAADLRQLETLEKALGDGAVMSSRNVIMVPPTAGVGGLVSKIAKAKNGDILVGNPEQVGMLQFANQAGLQVAAAQIERLERKLQYAFLMHQAVQRDAERVTATEINSLVEEIENALGGVYTLLSRDMMEWRMQYLIKRMQEAGTLPSWESGDIHPRLLTGFEALGRDRDVLRIDHAAQLVQMFGEHAFQAIDVGEFLRSAFIALGLHDFTYTKEEMAANAEQMQQQQLMQQLGDKLPQLLAQTKGE